MMDVGLLVRRPALAVFSAVYMFARKARQLQSTICPREVEVMCGLAPLLFTSLVAQVCAVDACWGPPAAG